MKIFRLNYEFFTFISGALISMAISLLFEVFKNKFSSVCCLVSSVCMFLASFFGFLLSVSAKEFQELYQHNIKIKENLSEPIENAWYKTIYVAEDIKRLNCRSISLILYLLLMIISCLGSMILYYFSS